MPMTQNVSKNRMDCPMHEQSLSSSMTEAITQEMIQDKNREIPLYQDPIYSPLKGHQKIYDHKI